MARRKQLKKAQYYSFSNCFDNQTDMAGKWGHHFGNEHPICFEMGCGHGTFSYALAGRYPQRNFVGVDLKAARMWRAANMAQQDGRGNLAFLCQDLKRIQESVGENEADEIWITFPDPFPKKRQAKHRMINPAFLEQYAYILKPGGRIHYKTDNLDLFHYSLEVFVKQEGLRLEGLSFDLHNNEEIHADAKVLTEYEKQFLEMGMRINYACLSFEAQAAY